jgi:AraC-like DNA-binding protein
VYTNYAYIGENDEDIVDNTQPLLITAAGYNKLVKSPVIVTERLDGRGDYQLIYIASGKGHFFFDDSETVVSHGNIVLFRPGEKQLYYYYLDVSTESFWVHFTGYEAGALFDSLSADKNVFFIGDSSDFPTRCDRIIREIQAKRINYQEISSLLFRELILVIGRYLSEEGSVNSDTLNEVERAINYFNDNFTKEINIKEYATARHMSASWFIRNFKTITKLSPLQYIINLRITNAKALLINTDYPISKIASVVGFENALYFSRIFRKHTGLSPVEFKKKFN